MFSVKKKLSVIFNFKFKTLLKTEIRLKSSGNVQVLLVLLAEST